MGRGFSKTLQSDKVEHDRLGIIKILTSKPQQLPRIKLKRQIQSAQRFTQWQRQIKLLLQQDFREVFYLPQSYQFVQEGVCGTSGSIQMEFEYYKYTLQSQITTRQANQMPFEQTELWYLLYNLLEAAFLLQPIGKRIGDVHPQNIVINQKGRVKVIPVCLFPGGQNSYDKMIQQKVSDAFLAPQQIDNGLIERGIYPSIDSCKAQVFTIGLTLLLAASLQDGYDLYERSVLRFKSGKKRQLFNQMGVSYSTYFCSIMNQMIEENPQKRRSSSDFFRELNKYQDQILSLRKFNMIQNKIKQAEREQIGKNLLESQASIADFLTQNEGKGSSSTPENSLIQNFKSF